MDKTPCTRTLLSFFSPKLAGVRVFFFLSMGKPAEKYDGLLSHFQWRSLPFSLMRHPPRNRCTETEVLFHLAVLPKQRVHPCVIFPSLELIQTGVHCRDIWPGSEWTLYPFSSQMLVGTLELVFPLICSPTVTSAQNLSPEHREGDSYYIRAVKKKPRAFPRDSNLVSSPTVLPVSSSGSLLAVHLLTLEMRVWSFLI